MISRRPLLAAIPAVLATQARAATGSFDSFLAGLRAEAHRSGISRLTIDRALVGLHPNQEVLDRERHPPEFTLTWARYRALLLTDKRVAAGRVAWQRNRSWFERVERRYGVGPGVILGIWGVESSYGKTTGSFHVVDALATLAWGSGRPRFFRSELMAALEILDHGDVTPARMTGSYAGAMGQPQFMPSSYLHYAVDFLGNGRRNIWTSVPDVLASIANYLARNGWRTGGAWGAPVRLPHGFDTALAGRGHARPVGAWERLGVRPVGGGRMTLAAAQPASLLLPDGPGGAAFLIGANFAAIRRYNPSDFYALLVGLLGDEILT